MKSIILFAAFLAAQPLAAGQGEPGLELDGYVSAWIQDCPSGVCSLPKPGERNRRVSLPLALPGAPGDAAAARSSQTLSLGADGEIKAELSFYAICPYGGKGDSCAGRYFQAQVTLSGPAGAFCASAFNAEDFSPFPVMMCAGTAPDGRRFGLTLHRNPL
jgi:hypothetical protein